jgi:hypothetical protein
MTIDMSAKAVTARIKRASQLRRLCLSLGKAKRFVANQKQHEELNKENQSAINSGRERKE